MLTLSDRLFRAARALPELWFVLGLSLFHWATMGLVPVTWRQSLGWTIHPYQVFVTFVSLCQFMLVGAMFMRWRRLGGSWLTRLPTYFGVSIGLWGLPGLIVAASARFPIQVVVAGGALLTTLVTLAAFIREVRSPSTLASDYEAADEGRTDIGVPFNSFLMVLSVVGLGIMVIISLNGPVSNDDNLQLMYAQDNLVVPRINEFEPVFGTGIHPSTRGSLTTWPVNLAVFPYLNGLPPQVSFWLMRTLLMVLDLLAVYTLSLRLWGKRNQALFSTLLYGLFAVIYTTDLDGIGFGLFARNMQDKFVVRYTLFPVALAWSMAYFQKVDWRKYWVAGLITLGQGATHPMAVILLGIPLGGVGLMTVLMNLKGIERRVLWPGHWHWPGFRAWPRAAWNVIRNFVLANWPIWQPFLLLAVFSMVSVALPLAAKASPDAPVIAYSLTDTRDPSLSYRINLAVNNYRLLINDSFGETKYIVHPQVFLNSTIILPMVLLPILLWKQRRHLNTCLLVGTYLLNPVLLLTPFIIQKIGEGATPWVLYRFAWPLSLLGPVLLGFGLWTLLEWLSSRVKWNAIRTALPAMSLMMLATVLADDIRGGLTFLQQAQTDPMASRCRTLQPLFTRIPDVVGQGTVVLSTVDIDICLPASAAYAYTVEYGLSSTVNRFPKSRMAEGERRFADSHEFMVSKVVDRNMMNTLARWNVGLIILRQDHPLIAQLDYLTQFFRLEFQEDRYRVYRVLPEAAVNVLTDMPPIERWKHALWAGHDPLVEANTFWTEGRWEDALSAYRPLTDPRQPAEMRYLAWVGMGRAYQSAGRLDEALSAFRAALTVEANDPGTWLLLSNAYQLKRDYAVTVEAAQHAVDLVSWHPEALQLLGDAQRLQGNLNAARAAYERSVMADYALNSAPYYRTLGALYNSVLWTDDAIAAYHLSIAVRESLASYFFLANVYLDRDDYAAAAALAQKAHTVEFWSDLPYLIWGRIAVEQGQLDVGLEHYQQAIFRNPQSEAVVIQSAALTNARGARKALQATQMLVSYKLGFASTLLTAAQSQLTLGNVEEALQASQSAWTWDPLDGSKAVFIANIYQLLGREAQATRFYRAAISVSPSKASAYTGLSSLARTNGDWGTAIGWAWAAMTASPYNSSAVTALADLQAQQGDLLTALTTYRLAVSVDPASSFSYVALGNLYLSMGQAAAAPATSAALHLNRLALAPPRGCDPAQCAQALFEKASQLNPSSSAPYLGLGNLALDSGQLDEAIAYFEKATQLTPYHGDTWIALGGAYQQAARLEEAEQALKHAVANDPGLMMGYTTLGQLYVTLARRDEATHTYQQAISDLSWQSDGYVALGGLLEKAGDAQGARAQYNLATNLEPGQAAAAYAALGQFYQWQGDFAQAESFLLKASAVDSNWLLSLGQMYQAAGHRAAARAQYQLTLIRLPVSGQASAYVSMATLSLAEGQTAQAIDEGQLAIKLAPTNVLAYTTLARAYLVAGQPDLAVQTYKNLEAAVPGSPEAYLAYGDFLRLRGEWSTALKLYQKARDLAPGQSEAWVALGDTYRARGDFEQALEAYETAAQVEPNNLNALIRLGLAYQSLARYAEAEATFLQAVEADRTHTEALLNLGALHVKRNQLTAAIKAYKQVIALRPTEPTAYMALGGLYREQGDSAQALFYYEQATIVAPSLGSAWEALAGGQLVTGQTDAAQASYEKAIRVEPGYSSAYSGLGLLYWRLGQWAEAEKAFRAGIAADASAADAYLNLAGLLQAQGRFAQAQAELQNGIALNPGLATLFGGLGNYYLSRGQTDLALTTLEQAVELEAGEAHHTLALASAYFNVGRVAEARALYEHAIQIESASGETYTALGNFERRAGHFEEAESTFQAGIMVDPNVLDNYLALASQYAQLNQVPQAEDTFELAINTHPGSADAHSAQADFLRSRGEWDAALKLYQQATQLEPASASPWLSLGAGYAAQAQFADALKAYQTAIQIEPADPDPLLSLGSLYQNLADFERATLAFQTAAQWDQSRNEAWLNLGRVAAQQNQREAALMAYKQAVVIRPTDPNAHIALGGALQGVGKTAEALAEFETAVEVAPMSGQAWDAFGSAQQESLDVAEAQTAFEKAIEVEPGYGPTYIDLALLHESQGNTMAATLTLESAIAFNPADPTSYVNLGQFLQGQAEFDLAEVQFEAAVEAAPGSGLALTALGNFYLSRYQPAEAISTTLKAVAIDPGYLGAYTRLSNTPLLLHALTGLAQMYQSRADFENAEKTLLEARTLAPAAADVYLGLAEFYLGRNQLKEAEQVLDAGLLVAPTASELWLTKSNVALARGNPTQAIADAQQALTANPSAPDAWLSLAGIYLAQAQFTKSIEAYAEASAIAPSDPRPYLNLADLYLLRGQSALALESTNTALALNPNSANAYLTLGRYYAQVGQPLVAQSHYITATVTEPTLADAFNTLGLSYRLLGQWKKAEVTYQQGLEVAPLATQNYIDLGMLYLASGLNGSAVKMLTEASEVAPTSGEVWNALGTIQATVGNSGAAVAAYTTGMKVAPGFDGNYIDLGQWQMGQGQFSSAEQTFWSGLGVRPTSGSLYAELAALKARLGDLTNARSYYQTALAVNPINTTNYIQYGQLLVTLSESSNAIKQYQAALGINPNVTQAWGGLGRVYHNLGYYTDAISAYRAALTRHAQLWPYPAPVLDAYLGLDEVYTLLGQPEAALSVYQTAAGVTPGASLPAQFIAQEYRERGDLGTAITYYQRAMGLEGGNVDPRIALADIYQLQGDWAAAKAEYDRAIGVRPASASAYLGLGNGYLAQGYLDLARQAYLHATELAPTSATPWLSLGAWAQAQGDLASAQNYYQQAIATDGRSADAYLSAGRVYEAQGNPSAAYDMYSRAIQVNASLAEPWVLRGLLNVSGSPSDPNAQAAAEADYRQALLVQPGNPDARVQLANLYVEQKAWDLAHAEIEAGLALTPGYSPFYVVTGHWWDGQSRFDEAIIALEKAAQLDGVNLNAYGALVNVLDHYNIYVNPPCVTNPVTGEVICRLVNPDAPSALPDRTVYYEGQSQLTPGAMWLHGLLSTFYQESIVSDVSAAARHLEVLIARYPEFPNYHRQLAEVYEQLNRPSEAARQWNLYLALTVTNPNRETAIVHLAQLQLIITPVTVEPWNPIVSLHGSAAIQNFQSYQMDYARSDNSNNWLLIAGPVFSPVYNDELAKWDTTNLSGGEYLIRLTATDTFGMQSFYFVQVTLNR